MKMKNYMQLVGEAQSVWEAQQQNSTSQSRLCGWVIVVAFCQRLFVLFLILRMLKETEKSVLKRKKCQQAEIAFIQKFENLTKLESYLRWGTTHDDSDEVFDADTQIREPPPSPRTEDRREARSKIIAQLIGNLDF